MLESKKETSVQVFSFEISEVFKNTYFKQHLIFTLSEYFSSKHVYFLASFFNNISLFSFFDTCLLTSNTVKL